MPDEPAPKPRASQQSSSSSLYAQTDIYHDGELVAQAGDTVSASDVGGNDNLEVLKQAGSVKDSEPVELNYDPTVGAVASVADREGDMMVTDEDTKDAKTNEEVFRLAAEKVGERGTANPL